jgi:hypothetical protein
VCLDTLPLRVNGDDCLLGVNSKTDQEKWKAYVHCVGFSMSLGKCYINRNICSINSKFFERRRRASVSTEFEYVKGPRVENIFNTRWRVEVDPRDRSTARGSYTDRWEVGPGLAGTLHQDLCDTSTFWDADFLRKEFINYNIEHLKITRRPWFVPVCLGGLGLIGKRSLEEAKYVAFALRKHSTGHALPQSVVHSTVTSSSRAMAPYSRDSARWEEAQGFHKRAVKLPVDDLGRPIACAMKCRYRPVRFPIPFWNYAALGLLPEEIERRHFMLDTQLVNRWFGQARKSDLEPCYRHVVMEKYC